MKQFLIIISVILNIFLIIGVARHKQELKEFRVANLANFMSMKRMNAWAIEFCDNLEKNKSDHICTIDTKKILLNDRKTLEDILKY